MIVHLSILPSSKLTPRCRYRYRTCNRSTAIVSSFDAFFDNALGRCAGLGPVPPRPAGLPGQALNARLAMKNKRLWENPHKWVPRP